MRRQGAPVTGNRTIRERLLHLWVETWRYLNFKTECNMVRYKKL